MKNIRMFCFAMLAAFLLLGTAMGVPAKSPESEDPIKITIHDWTSQRVSSHIMGSVLEKMGYNVEYVIADYLAQFSGLEGGDLHLAMEIWETTGRDALLKSLATGDTEDMGETGMHAKEDWWFPSYVKEICPGLPDWQALNACAEKFSTPETAPKGRYLGGAATWGGHDEERIEALGLNFEVIHAGTAAALSAEIKAAYERKEPIVAWVWSPNWVPYKYKGEWVDFPDYTDECYNDPKWGSNPGMKYDCGKPEGWIKKVAWAGLKKKWPGAHKAIGNFHITNDEMGALISEVDLEDRKIEDVVSQWMKENAANWKKWIQ